MEMQPAMANDAVLLPLFYLPPVNWLTVFAKSKLVCLEQQEHYIKSTYRNRCHIAAVNGIQRLTIPLRKGKNQQQPIREVHIAYDEPWQQQHWRAICTAYGNSPFFEHYSDILQPFFKDKNYELLWDWNYDLLAACLKILKLEKPIFLSQSYEVKPAETVDFRFAFSPNNPEIRKDIKPVKYSQVFEDRLGFLENISCLDLIFCSGHLQL